MNNDFIGHYRITGKLGEGGMGEVLRAIDTRLNREVAIKVLPDSFAQDPERLARFQREAEVLATLNHTGIASIYGVEETQNQSALILELVEGKTLDQHLRQGPIALGDCISLFQQIALALEAAHGNGVVHRDLKPSNIKITPSLQAKILDFGLAKHLPQSEITTDPKDLEDSPTVTDIHTRPGTILGTAAYMSPEQARGKAIDKRTDIWAFGCLFFECLTGENPFRGQDVTESLARVLEREPDWGLIPPETSPAILFLLKKCLTKDQNKRLHEIADARIDLEQIIADPSGSSLAPGGIEGTTNTRPPKTAWSQLLPWSIAALAILFALLKQTIPKSPPEVTTPTQLQTYSLNLKPGTYLSTVIGASFVLSKDGSRMVYQAQREGTEELYWRDLEEDTFHRIPQSEDSSPTFAFSPNQEHLLFYSAGWVRLHSFQGGHPRELVQSGMMGGAAWLTDTKGFFANEHGVFQISLNQQAEVSELIGADESKHEIGFSCLSPLPDGESLLVGVLKDESAAGSSAFKSEIEVINTSTRQRQKIGLTGTLTAIYHNASGHLLYGRDDVLWARRFDTKDLRFIGDEFLLLNDLGRDWAGLSHQFTLADNGTLIYARGHQADPKYNLILATSTDNQQVVDIPPGDYQLPRVSPDGSKVLLVRNLNIAAVVDIESAQLSETEMSTDNFILVKFDTQSLIYTRGSYSDEEQPLYRKQFGTRTVDELIWESSQPAHGVRAISPDGNLFAIVNRKWGEDEDILIYNRKTESPPEPIREKDYGDFTPCFSPTQPWIAFCSTQSRQPEIYLSPLDGSRLPLQVSKGGGSMPVWAPDGKRLYFRGGDKKSIAAVDIQSWDPPSVSAPKTIVNEAIRSSGILIGSGFDVRSTPEGDQVVFLKSAYEDSEPQFATRLAVLVNFDAYLDSKAQEAGERAP